MNEIKIGQKYTSRGKYPRQCTVVDIYKTYNASGELVKTSYVATQEFAGQVITDYDVPAATIIRGGI